MLYRNIHELMKFIKLEYYAAEYYKNNEVVHVSASKHLQGYLVSN